jgi:hypothetical protein
MLMHFGCPRNFSIKARGCQVNCVYLQPISRNDWHIIRNNAPLSTVKPEGVSNILGWLGNVDTPPADDDDEPFALVNDNEEPFAIDLEAWPGMWPLETIPSINAADEWPLFVISLTSLLLVALGDATLTAGGVDLPSFWALLAAILVSLRCRFDGELLRLRSIPLLLLLLLLLLVVGEDDNVVDEDDDVEDEEDDEEDDGRGDRPRLRDDERSDDTSVNQWIIIDLKRLLVNTMPTHTH